MRSARAALGQRARPRPGERRFFVGGFHRKLDQLSDQIIVHSQSSKEILTSQGVDEASVCVIPHGTDLVEPGNPQKGRELAQARDGEQILLCFGFIHMQKNLQAAIRALPGVLKKAPETRLVIAGRPGGGAWFNRMYVAHLKRVASRCGVADRVTFLDRFLDDPQMSDLHAAARVMLLPYSQGYGSASGVLHMAMAYGIPVVCSQSIKFEEVGTHVSEDLLIDTGHLDQWSDKIIELLHNDAAHQTISDAMRAYGAQTLWSEIAQRHLHVYRNMGQPQEEHTAS